MGPFLQPLWEHEKKASSPTLVDKLANIFCLELALSLYFLTNHRLELVERMFVTLWYRGVNKNAKEEKQLDV